MIKARKDKLIILGLSDENMRRLKDNQPIKFPMDILQIPGMPEGYEIMIFSGKTEESMELMMRSLANPQN
jgi:hypothetical protein